MKIEFGTNRDSVNKHDLMITSGDHKFYIQEKDNGVSITAINGQVVIRSCGVRTVLLQNFRECDPQ